MSNQRPSFAKRDREMKLKDKARAKAERRAARRAEPRTGQGPPIATNEEVGMMPVDRHTGPDATTAPASTPPASTPTPTRPR